MSLSSKRFNHSSIQRKIVWSGWMRIAHAAIALTTSALVLTAWLLQHTTGVNKAALDYHYIAGAVLAMGLILRAILLFLDTRAGHWRHLVPSRRHLRAYKEMLRFYFSFAHWPLPKWFAHNPLWVPLYILMFLALTFLVLTGYLMTSQPIIAGFYLPEVHNLWASIITILVIFHIVTVIFHDMKGSGSDISAMINGHRVFIIEHPEHPVIHQPASVAIDEILKKGHGLDGE